MKKIKTIKVTDLKIGFEFKFLNVWWKITHVIKNDEFGITSKKTKSLIDMNLNELIQNLRDENNIKVEM